MPVVALLLRYNGPLDNSPKILAPARRFGKPVADLVGPIPYTARQTMLDAPNAEHGLHRYWRSALTEQISDELIDAAVDGAASFTSPLSAMIFFYMHGAATRPLPTETAFAARRAQWDFDAIGQSPALPQRPSSTSHGCGGSGLDSSRTFLAVPTSTTWPLIVGQRQFGPPSGRTTLVFGRSRPCTTRRIFSA